MGKRKSKLDASSSRGKTKKRRVREVREGKDQGQSYETSLSMGTGITVGARQGTEIEGETKNG